MVADWYADFWDWDVAIWGVSQGHIQEQINLHVSCRSSNQDWRHRTIFLPSWQRHHSVLRVHVWDVLHVRFLDTWLQNHPALNWTWFGAIQGDRGRVWIGTQNSQPWWDAFWVDGWLGCRIRVICTYRVWCRNRPTHCVQLPRGCIWRWFLLAWCQVSFS